jgi:2-oxoglutarate/2-oxoacid ferredoxin oxidoreductase subunit alpha
VILDTSVFENKRFGFDIQPKSDDSGFYPRYKLSDTGVSLRTFPGTSGGVYVANSYAHTDYGLSSEESVDRVDGVDKRFKKLVQMQQEIPQQFWEIEEGSQITLISFGSTKGPVRRAKRELKNKNKPVNILNLSWLWPFPKDQVIRAITSVKNVIVVEGNKQGQLADLITQETGIIIKNRLNRYDGRPFNWQEIVSYVENFNV